MASGLSFLRRIDDAQKMLESQFAQQTSQLHAARLKQTQLKGAIARLLLEVARTQAEALSGSELDGYDQVTRTLEQNLVEREKTAESWMEQQQHWTQQLQERRSASHVLGEQMDAIVGRIAAIEASAQQELEADAEFASLVGAEQTAQERAFAARTKADKALKERTSKSGGYLQDPLFCYLKDRGFGTAAYQAPTLVRAIDGWVASLCGYPQARRDFDALQKLPEYLSAHADAMERARVDAGIAVAESRDRVRAKLGLVLQEKDRDQLQIALDKAQERIDVLERSLSERRDELRRFSEWNDPMARKLVEQLAGVMESESLSSLQARVAKTASTKDDEALQEMQSLGDELRQCDELVAKLERTHGGAAERLEGIRDVRQRYKRERFDSSDYVIRGSAADERLQGYVQGSVVEDDLWHIIRNSAKHEPPVTRSSSRSGGGFGGGGFSSGGGFGGGGFKTGGGF